MDYSLLSKEYQLQHLATTIDNTLFLVFKLVWVSCEVGTSPYLRLMREALGLLIRRQVLKFSIEPLSRKI